MKRALIAIEWLRKQPLRTRLTISAVFASVSVISWLVGYVWPWGFIMAVVPLVIPRASKAEMEFLRNVKPTDEAAPAMWSGDVMAAELVPALETLSQALSAGFGADRVKDVSAAAGALPVGHEKQFQYVAVFTGRPISLQVTVRRQTADMFVLSILTDPQLITHLSA
jgi:hypothetical protein